MHPKAGKVTAPSESDAMRLYKPPCRKYATEIHLHDFTVWQPKVPATKCATLVYVFIILIEHLSTFFSAQCPFLMYKWNISLIHVVHFSNTWCIYFLFLQNILCTIFGMHGQCFCKYMLNIFNVNIFLNYDGIFLDCRKIFRTSMDIFLGTW